MNRIILSVLTIVIALSLAAWTTLATWSDAVTISSNKIQTGTADLQVSATGVSGPWDTSATVSTFNLSGLVPGGASQNAFAFALKNNSSEGVVFNTSSQITSSSIDGTGAPDQSKLLIAVYPSGESADSSGSGWVSLQDWQSASKNLNTTLNPDNTKGYNLAAKLDSTANNDWQGKTVTFTLTLTGQQP